MKVISIIGSPHGMNGSTGPVVKNLLEAAQKAGAETEAFSLADLSIQPCKGCEVCSKTGTCVIDDDFDVIKNAMIEADGVIFASPNYMYNVSGQMKILFDRCNSLCQCQMMVGKYGATVMTSGGPYTGVGEEYLLLILGRMGFWKAGSIYAIQAQLTDEDERAKIMESAANLGNRVVKAIRSKEIFPDQEAERNEFFETLKCVATMQKEVWPFAYEYMNSRWGLET